MRILPLIAAVAIAATVPTFAYGADSMYDRTVAESRENMKCRNHIDEMHLRTVPMRDELLNRDITLNRPTGTMHTGDVQNIQRKIKAIWQSAKYKMVRSVDFERCKEIADRTVERIENVIEENAY